MNFNLLPPLVHAHLELELAVLEAEDLVSVHREDVADLKMGRVGN